MLIQMMQTTIGMDTKIFNQTYDLTRQQRDRLAFVDSFFLTPRNPSQLLSYMIVMNYSRSLHKFN